MISTRNLCFKQLNSRHFPLLLAWLNSPHVQEFWDRGEVWTKEKIEEKYGSYVDGFKKVKNVKLPIQALIIYCDNQPIGYIQVYNAFHFPREGYNLSDALKDTVFNKGNLAAIDLYIAVSEYVGKGIGPAVITQFLKEYVWSDFEGCLVDPDKINQRAIRAYEKAGFIKVSDIINDKVTVMIATQPV